MTEAVGEESKFNPGRTEVLFRLAIKQLGELNASNPPEIGDLYAIARLISTNLPEEHELTVCRSWAGVKLEDLSTEKKMERLVKETAKVELTDLPEYLRAFYRQACEALSEKLKLLEGPEVAEDRS